jgi:hypothetical protein
MINGKYIWSPDTLKRNHQLCVEYVEKSLANGVDVVVSNTFTTNSEILPYIELAKKYGVDYKIIEMKGKFGSIHNVPKEAIEAMRKRWECIDVTS